MSLLKKLQFIGQPLLFSLTLKASLTLTTHLKSQSPSTLNTLEARTQTVCQFLYTGQKSYFYEKDWHMPLEKTVQSELNEKTLQAVYTSRNELKLDYKTVSGGCVRTSIPQKIVKMVFQPQIVSFSMPLAE